MSNLRWGILSTARIGKSVIKGIGLSNACCMQAVASREKSRAIEWAKEHGIPRAFGSYEELLSSGEVDAIYNPLPNSMHAEWTIKALDAGLPVLCEKPFAVNADEARKIVKTARKKQLPVAEAFMYRYHPVYDRVRELVDQGAIGELVTIRSTFSFPLNDPENIRMKPELAGGALMDVGCYCVNFSRMMARCKPACATAFVRQGAVDKTTIACLEFPNSLLAYFECSFETHTRMRAVLEGTGGTLILPSPWFPGEVRAEIILRHGDEEKREYVAGANTYQLEVEDFVNACLTHRPTRWPAEDAIANMAVIDAICRSVKERGPVTVAGVQAGQPSGKARA